MKMTIITIISILALNTGCNERNGENFIGNKKPQTVPIGVYINHQKQWGDLITHGFLDDVKEAENGVKAGLCKRTNRWYSYNSPEGGTQTIGYGHKLTREEANSGKFRKGLSKNQAEQLLLSDLNLAISRLKMPNSRWNRLSWKQKWLLLDYQFNVGSVEHKFPKFTHGVLTENKSILLKEYLRTYKKKNGKRYYLGDRNNRTLNFIKDNF